MAGGLELHDLESPFQRKPFYVSVILYVFSILLPRGYACMSCKVLITVYMLFLVKLVI